MPIHLNLLESAAFFNFNAAPAPMLDLFGALAYQTVSTAVKLGVFTALNERPSGAAELAQALGTTERGTQRLLSALSTIGYVTEKDGRYNNTPMTQKWLIHSTEFDMNAAITCWDAFLHDLWPHASEVVRSGERPFDFYEFTARDPSLSHAHQRMMMSSANIIGADIVKKVALPDGPGRLLDVGGGHGRFAAHFCEANPNLTATIMDSEVALETARQVMEKAGLGDRVDLYAANLWTAAWGDNWDAVLLFNLLHHYELDTNLKLLQKTHAALRPGGKVAILDQVPAKESTSASYAAIQLVGWMYFVFADGRTFTRDELTDLLIAAGFRNIQFHPIRTGGVSVYGLLIAEK